MTTQGENDEENGPKHIENIDQLDENGFDFTSVWKQWKSRPLNQLGEGWFFKFFLWCIR